MNASQHRVLDCHGDLRLDHVHSPRKRRPSSIALSLTTAFVSSTSPTISHFWRWILISRVEATWEICFSEMPRANWDAGMLKVANFYKCYRAFVRGKVESIQATEKETSNSGEHQKQATRYFRLALGYAIAGAQPLILVVMGRVGTGKSTMAKRLASEFDWLVFSSDGTRKTLAGVPLTQRTPSELRAKIYSAQMTRRTYRKLIGDGLAAIGCSRGRRPRPLQPHHAVILDATFSTQALRKFLCDECKKVNVTNSVHRTRGRS